MDEMVIEFSNEMKDLLSDIEDALMRIDGMFANGVAPSKDLLNDIFRNLHTIKGSSSFFEMEITRGLAHKMEDLLDYFRKGELEIQPHHVQMLFEGVDCLNQIADLLAQLQNESQLEEQSLIVKEKIISALNEIENNQTSEDNTPSQDSIPTKNDQSSQQLASVQQAQPTQPRQSTQQSQPIQPMQSPQPIHVSQPTQTSKKNEPNNPKTVSNPNPVEQNKKIVDQPSIPKELLFGDDLSIKFATESNDLLSESEQIVIQLEKDTDINVNELLNQLRRNFHTIKGNAGLMNFKDIESLTHFIETSLENALNNNDQAIEYQIYYEAIDELFYACKLVGDGKPYVLNSNLKSRLLGEPEQESNESEPVRDITPIPQNPTPFHAPSIMPKQSIVQKQAPVNRSTQVIPNQPPPPPVKQQPKEMIVQQNQQSVTPNQQITVKPINEQIQQTQQTQKSQKNIRPNPQKQTKTGAQQDAFVRVPVNKLDMLMDLLGEVILVSSMLTHHPDLIDIELEGFENTSHQMDILLRQLQDAAMSLRMIPIANVFQRMKRLIRDFVQETGKNIDLEIIGEETEVDKSVAEMLNDPLVHLLRNAADHGVEPSDERKRANKSDVGKIKLTANQAGGELRIIVEDDGRGLNREKILEKAKLAGLCGPDEEPDDQTIWAYIFNPGFSTAETISNISGRGVGMDVVMTNIKSMRGKVSIDTQPGKGSRITLHIPLMLAILDGMVIQVENILYVLPIETVIEILLPTEKQINFSSVDQRFVLRFRNQLVPVLSLKQLYLNKKEDSLTKNNVFMIVEAEGNLLAMPVDELVGQQQVVIKPLTGHLKNIRGVSGCSLLGSGSIAMVLDVNQLYHIQRSQDKSKYEKSNRLN